MLGRLLGTPHGLVVGALAGWGVGTVVAELMEMHLEPAVLTILLAGCGGAGVGLAAGFAIGLRIDRRPKA